MIKLARMAVLALAIVAAQDAIAQERPDTMRMSCAASATSSAGPAPSSCTQAPTSTIAM